MVAGDESLGLKGYSNSLLQMLDSKTCFNIIYSLQDIVSSPDCFKLIFIFLSLFSFELLESRFTCMIFLHYLVTSTNCEAQTAKLPIVISIIGLFFL